MTGVPEIQPRPSRDHDYLGSKITKSIFFNFFTTKSPNFISNLNDDCSQLSFEVYNICVAQKLRILEFLIEFFFAWTLATSATFRGRNFNLRDLNRVSNFSYRPQLPHEPLFVALKRYWEELYYVFSIRAESAPPPLPAYLGDQKARTL